MLCQSLPVFDLGFANSRRRHGTNKDSYVFLEASLITRRGRLLTPFFPYRDKKQKKNRDKPIVETCQTPKKVRLLPRKKPAEKANNQGYRVTTYFVHEFLALEA